MMPSHSISQVPLVLTSKCLNSKVEMGSNLKLLTWRLRRCTDLSEHIIVSSKKIFIGSQEQLHFSNHTKLDENLIQKPSRGLYDQDTVPNL